MSNILNFSQMPNLKSENEKQQWMEGKASRLFVLNEVGKIYPELEMIGEELKRAAVGFSQIFTLQKILGLQMETLVRLIDKAVPDFKNQFQEEYKKTIEFSQFLESFSSEGANGAKPFREKLDMVRDWNKEKDIKITAMHFGIAEYVVANYSEFTLEEVEALAEEFSVPELVDNYKEKLTVPTTVEEKTN